MFETGQCYGITVTYESYGKECYGARKRVLRNTGLQYWDGDNMAEHTDEVIDACKYKYPEPFHVFYFDWSSGHEKKPSDGLNAQILNLNFGSAGKKLDEMKAMRDGTVNAAQYPDRKIDFPDDKQSMCFKSLHVQPRDQPPWYAPKTPRNEYADQPKGCKQLLWERGLWHDKMSLDGGIDKIKVNSARHILSVQPDFMAQQSQLEELVTFRGCGIDMTPKFHCELVALERRWGRSKWYCRRTCRYQYEALKHLVPFSLVSPTVCSLRLLRNYFRKSRDYMAVYRAGVDSGKQTNSLIHC